MINSSGTPSGRPCCTDSIDDFSFSMALLKKCSIRSAFFFFFEFNDTKKRLQEKNVLIILKITYIEKAVVCTESGKEK